MGLRLEFPKKYVVTSVVKDYFILENSSNSDEMPCSVGSLFVTV